MSAENLPSTNDNAHHGYKCNVGKLLKLHLVNFMCHSNFEIEFNPRINVLVGNNGSGKSAVFSALIIGLGKNANAAGRSSNIKRKLIVLIISGFQLFEIL